MQITANGNAMASITSPDVERLLAPVLPALPPAAMSAVPPTAILPLLSPILRQRVQLLSSSSNEPWLRLLCYDTSKAAKLAEVVKGGNLEPHPVSGEVEVDWESNTEMRYRRVDRETLQALVSIGDLGLTFLLVYCVGDKDGGGDGWRVGEVAVADQPFPFGNFDGKPTIADAEQAFVEKSKVNGVSRNHQANGSLGVGTVDEEDDDDDGYWDRYDATPARTPATKRSPAPQSTQSSQVMGYPSSSAEDAYYAQYDSVQPAMDNHDPDGEVEHIEVAPPLGLGGTATGKENTEQIEANETNGTWTLAEEDDDKAIALQHPRPASSASSSGSQTVAKLEETAGKQEQSEFGVKQHISRSVRSLFHLSRASGIDREEFERLVQTELNLLGMMDEDE
jgi:hypothetical protein